MSLVNQNVEYRNLLGFPDYNGNATHFLKSTDEPTGFKDVDSAYLRQDLNVNPYTVNNANYIVRKPDNMITYNSETHIYTANISENYPFEYVLEDGVIHSITAPQDVIITTTASTDWVKTFVFFSHSTQSFVEQTSFMEMASPFLVAEIDIDPNGKVYINNYPTMSNRKEETSKMTWVSPSLWSGNKFPYSKAITNMENRTYEMILKNRTAEHGYENGDIASFAEAPYIYVDDKFIGYLTAESPLKIIHKAYGTTQEINPSNWYVIFKIW